MSEFTEVNEITRDLALQKIRQETEKMFQNYRQSIKLMATDAPISVLGLKKSLEKLLLSHGFVRIYDLLDCDFTKVEWLNDANISDLTSRLDQFVSML